jgi:hypothetical protein
MISAKESSLLPHLHDHFHFYGGAEGEAHHAYGGAGVVALVAVEADQEV